MSPLAPADVERFRALIQDRLGIACADWQEERLPALLHDRIRKTRSGDAPTYLQFLAGTDLSSPELGALAEQLTVGETYFFREPRQLHALIAALPLAAARRRRSGGPLRILSAGCSSGEEAYSVALLLREHNEQKPPIDASIMGIDMNPAALKKAREALYSAWSLRATPDPIKERWFIPAGPAFRLRDEIRTMVTFEQRNLLTEGSLFYQPAAFDVVLCRNVTIYFSPDATAKVVERLERAIAPGGYLFLGHSESLRGLSDAFELMQTHDTFYYQRRDAACPAVEGAAARPPSERPKATCDPRRAFDAEAWMSAIQRSSERIEAVTRQLEIDDAAAKTATSTREKLKEAQAAFQAERFEDALSALLGARAASPGDPDVELMVAVIYFNQGLFAEAESICANARWNGSYAAAARYVLGLCREHEGCRAQAMDHYRSSIRLDKTFAMPYLRLGRLARRSGDIESARALARIAADLVVRERPDRLLLFGGGFHQNALVELCRAELLACEEAS